MATHVYIDGPSLYYGALKDRLGRWLDLETWCEQLLPGLDVARIDYFTAWAPQSSSGAVLRQRAYVRALATRPKTTTHFGRFERERRCTINGLNGTRKFHFRQEIRDVDVALTTALMTDAFSGACDVAIVVTSNSELRIPIAAVRQRGVRVGIVNPRPGRDGNGLREHADFFIRPSAATYVAAQLPRTIQDEHGTITAPREWLRR
jgi:uncharacterized LabA/DUF88 family protein